MTVHAPSAVNHTRTLALALSLAASAAQAQSALDTTTVTARRQIRLDGKPLAYTARAGFLPMRDSATGEVRANMFYVSYTVARPAGAAPRPIMFLWNGGPGSNAALVHVLAFGPKRLNTADRYPDFDVATQLTWSDNQSTWLGAADLVFVDPVGTGYSRPTQPAFGADFYNGAGDVRSVSTFIRDYVAKYASADAPLFIAGESYGVTRAAGVAHALEQRGTRVNGVILISLNLPLGEPVLTPEAEIAANLPLYVATAFYHRKLEPGLLRNIDSTLARAREWADRTYVPALARRTQLDAAERAAILRELSRFVGVPVAILDTARLTVNAQRYKTALLAAEGLVFGNYDSRMTRKADPPGTMYNPTKDPSLDKLLNQAGTLRYLRNELGVVQDVRYQGPFGGGYPAAKSFRGDWMSVRWKFDPPDTARAPGQTTVPPLRRAMDLNPAMRVLVMRGIFDTGACEAIVRAELLPSPLRERVTGKCYLGGHSPYTDKEPRLAMRRDVTAFIAAATRGNAK